MIKLTSVNNFTRLHLKKLFAWDIIRYANNVA